MKEQGHSRADELIDSNSLGVQAATPSRQGRVGVSPLRWLGQCAQGGRLCACFPSTGAARHVSNDWKDIFFFHRFFHLHMFNLQVFTCELPIQLEQQDRRAGREANKLSVCKSNRKLCGSFQTIANFAREGFVTISAQSSTQTLQ